MKFLCLPTKVTVVPIIYREAVLTITVTYYESGTHHVAHRAMEFTILPPLPLKGWEYRHTSSPDS